MHSRAASCHPITCLCWQKGNAAAAAWQECSARACFLKSTDGKATNDCAMSCSNKPSRHVLSFCAASEALTACSCLPRTPPPRPHSRTPSTRPQSEADSSAASFSFTPSTSAEQAAAPLTNQVRQEAPAGQSGQSRAWSILKLAILGAAIVAGIGKVTLMLACGWLQSLWRDEVP